MTGRHTVNTITSDALDELYDRLDRIRDAATLNRQGLIRAADLHAVIEAHAGPASDAPLRDQSRAAIKSLGTTETTLTRIRAACDQMERAVINADGRLLSPYDRGVDAAIRRVRKALNQPAASAHVYLSTGCLHGDHDYCQAMTGLNGAKRPGSCKHCGTKCICTCHPPRQPGDHTGTTPTNHTAP